MRVVYQRVSRPVLVVTVLALAGCGASTRVELPSNHGRFLDDALRRLHSAGLRATFPTAWSPCGDGLPEVVVQSPRAPVRLERHSVVSLKFLLAPIPSPVAPIHHARWTYVPRLIGNDAHTASRKLRAIWPCFRVRGANGTSAWHVVVVAQHPAPGTRVRAYGVRTPRGYRVTTVQLTVAAR